MPKIHLTRRHKNGSAIDKSEVTIVTASPDKPTVRVRPTREMALEDAFALMALEIRKMRTKSEAMDEELDHKDASKVIKYVDAFSKLVRTDIQHDQHTDPGHMSDAELLEAAQEAQRLLSEGEEVIIE